MRKGLSYLAYGVAAGVVLVGASHDALRAAGSSTSDKLALFAEVFNKVRDNYAEKPDDEKMIKSAIDGMLASLDPHSNYFDPKALQDFQSSMKGEEFGGLGLEVMMENGLVKVVSPVDMFHFFERDLARRRGVLDRGIGECAAFAQRQQSRRKPSVAHRHGDEVPLPSSEAQQPPALGQ